MSPDQHHYTLGTDVEARAAFELVISRSALSFVHTAIVFFSLLKKDGVV